MTSTKKGKMATHIFNINYIYNIGYVIIPYWNI